MADHGNGLGRKGPAAGISWQGNPRTGYVGRIRKLVGFENFFPIMLSGLLGETIILRDMAALALMVLTLSFHLGVSYGH
jgi:hypothetical protein